MDVDDGVWLVDEACDWTVEVFEEVELRTKYAPTAATTTITTTTAATVVLLAFRLL